MLTNVIGYSIKESEVWNEPNSLTAAVLKLSQIPALVSSKLNPFSGLDFVFSTESETKSREEAFFVGKENVLTLRLD